MQVLVAKTGIENLTIQTPHLWVEKYSTFKYIMTWLILKAELEP
jgi:hypothetical protein